jgi:pimeloyl-ACP methyl ester carboxylesterase
MLGNPSAARSPSSWPWAIPTGSPGPLAHALGDPIEHKLPRVRVPTLVTRGSSEPIVPSAWAQTATRLLPLGELAVVPGPHNASYGAADRLGELVRVFLDRRVRAHGGQAN